MSGAAILLFGVNLFLWAVQSAFFYFPRPVLEVLQEKGECTKRETQLLEMLANPRRLDLIIRFTNIGVRVLFVGVTFLLVLRAAGRLGLPLIVAAAIHLVLATVLLGAGEMLCRSLAIRGAERFTFFAVPAVRFLRLLTGPPLGLLFGVMRRAASRLGLKRIVPYLTVEEMIAVVEAGEEEGVIEAEEREMFHSIFDLADTSVREVMVPRVDMVAVERDEPIGDVLEKISECGHSRIPVFEKNSDRIVGILYAKDLLRIARSAEWDRPAGEVMREPFFVPEGKAVDDLLREFREEKVHLAVVKDEYGGTAGIVTLEDVIEEIVGEIQDEYDPDDILFVPHGDSTAVVNGKISIDDLNERFTISLPADRHETLGGYLYDLIDRIPSEGEVIRENGLEFTVEKVNRQRISSVRIRKNPAVEEETPDQR